MRDLGYEGNIENLKHLPSLREREAYKERLSNRLKDINKRKRQKIATSRTLLGVLELKHSKLLNFMRSLHLEYAKCRERVKEQTIREETEVNQKNENNLAKENLVRESKSARGELKDLYRKIVKRCHPDRNGDDEVLKQANQIAQVALLTKDLDTMRSVYEAVVTYREKPSAERRLISLRKEIEDLEKSISQNLQDEDSDFNHIAYGLRNDPERLEVEFVAMIQAEIKSTATKLKAFNQLVDVDSIGLIADTYLPGDRK